MIEYNNKYIKYRYLFRHHIANMEDLISKFKAFVDDYNNLHFYRWFNIQAASKSRFKIVTKSKNTTKVVLTGQINSYNFTV